MSAANRGVLGSGGDGIRTPRIVIVAVLIGLAIVVSAILHGDVPDFVSASTDWARLQLHPYSYIGSYGLLYIEESGVPLPAPGDVFVMYVGAHVPRSLLPWIFALWEA